MEIIKVIPRGYCQGVVRAILIAKKTVKENPDTRVTMLGMIVHNQFVVDACRKLGINFVEDKNKTRMELLEEISSGIVIFTAHGVSDDVIRAAKAKGLTCVDATCPDVIRTHNLVKEHSAVGDIIYIGKKNHPESEGTVGISDKIHLVTSIEDVDELKNISLKNILITNQTTLSMLDTAEIIAYCKKLFPDAIVAKEICNATSKRQEAVLQLQNVDLLIVVGDARSNNSNQLAKIAKHAGIQESYLIDSVLDLTPSMIDGYKRIAITSGSSTPNSITDQVVDFLNEYARTGIWQLPETVNVQLI